MGGRGLLFEASCLWVLLADRVLAFVAAIGLKYFSRRIPTVWRGGPSGSTITVRLHSFREPQPAAYRTPHPYQGDLMAIQYKVVELKGSPTRASFW